MNGFKKYNEVSGNVPHFNRWVEFRTYDGKRITLKWNAMNKSLSPSHWLFYWRYPLQEATREHTNRDRHARAFTSGD